MENLGVTVAIIEGDTILLTLREDFEVWCLPGGGVDEGELLADAARREVLEETGLEVELMRLVGTYSRVGWRNHHVLLFTARIMGGTLTPDPHEVVEARFFPFDALPEHLLIGQAHRIQAAVSGVCGAVVTENIPSLASIALTRSEVYALRDQSGLSRREFYERNVPPITPDRVKVEVNGC